MVKVPDEQLDRWLEDRESTVPNLVPGTEKRIFWHDKPEKKTPFSIIYIHGFCATRQEIAPTVDRVANRIGANLFYTRLVGHGRDGEAMTEATLEGFKRDSVEAWEIGRRIGEQVIIVATSTGAPLAAWLASEHNDIAAIVLISANFQPANKTANVILMPGGRLLTRIAAGKTYGFEPINEDHGRYWTASYPSKALRPMMETCRLGRRSALEDISVPALFLYTEHDDVVSLPAMEEAYERMGSSTKQMINVPEAKDHVMSGDIISPQATGIVVEHILQFLEVL